MRGRATAGAFVVALVLVLAGCGSSTGKTSTSSTTSTSQPGRARITSFVVPKSVQCGSDPNKLVRVAYAVSGAKRHQLLVDGRVEPAAAAPSATVNPSVHCDGGSHTIALVAIDAQGRRTSQVRFVTTRLPPAPPP